ncbi:hypothetical protein [Microlunatus sp. GCM10028923]|uniref:hypothetical protein n=1 Tax=Microlunatus sp. GCM10028923 TaxID=3273400 RepID=UPI00360EFC7B
MSGTPGAGKSTLGEALAAGYRAQGRPVDRYGEEELFTRPEFARVAAGFRGPGSPSRADFEKAYASWLRGLPDEAIAIMDWAPAGMAGDLPWGLADRSGYVRHLRKVRELAAGRVLQLRLRVSTRLATGRAAAERGEPWLDRYDGLARADGYEQGSRLDRIAAAAAHHEKTRDLENEAAAEAGWPVVPLDASGFPAEVHAAATAVIDTHLGRLTG